MPNQTITFGFTLENDEGTVDFTITRNDGTAVFNDPDNPGDMVDYYEQDNIDTTQTTDLSLPSGKYDIILVLVTNVDFNFSVSGVITSLDPAPKTQNVTINLPYTLVV
jgi:hypothetical protein